jgi:hypothetical protein
MRGGAVAGRRLRGSPPDGDSCSRRAGLQQCKSFVEMMMIVLLLFLQKQNLANTIYLFGLCTLLSRLGLHCELPQCITSVRMWAGVFNLGLPSSLFALPS